MSMEFNSARLIHLRLPPHDSDNNLTLPLFAFWMTESRDAVQDTSPRVPMEKLKIASPSPLHMMLMRTSQFTLRCLCKVAPNYFILLTWSQHHLHKPLLPKHSVKGSRLRHKDFRLYRLTFRCLKLNKTFRKVPFDLWRHVMVAQNAPEATGAASVCCSCTIQLMNFFVPFQQQLREQELSTGVG